MRFRTIKGRLRSISNLFFQNFSGGGVKRPLNNEDIEDDDNTTSSVRGGYNVFKTAKEQLVSTILLLYCQYFFFSHKFCNS